MPSRQHEMALPVLDHIDRHRESIIETLQRLIQFPTVNPPGDEKAHQEFVAAQLRDLGIEPQLVEAVPGRPNIVAVMRGAGGGRNLLHYAGHADVVSPGNPADWRCDPFAGEVHDGWLYGRGSADHKGSIAASLAAMRAIVESGVPLAGDILFLVPVDEERGSVAGTRHLIKTGLVYGDMGIYGSAGFLNQVLVNCAGTLNLEIHTIGKRAHGGYPHLGINAIEKASKLVLALQNMKFEQANPWWDPKATDLVSPTRTGTLVVTEIQGGGVGGVPDACRIKVERRLIPDESVNEAMAQITRVLHNLAQEDPDFQTGVDVTAAVSGINIRSDAPIVQAVCAAIRDLGLEPVIGGSSGGFDARWIVDALGIPMVSYGAGWNGPDGKFCLHAPNECIRIDDLIGMAKGFALIMLNVCGCLSDDKEPTRN